MDRHAGKIVVNRTRGIASGIFRVIFTESLDIFLPWRI